MGFFITDGGTEVFSFGDLFGVDCNGNVRIRISDYASINATTGEICMNSRWKKEEKPKQGLIKISDDEYEEWY